MLKVGLEYHSALLQRTGIGRYVYEIARRFPQNGDMEFLLFWYRRLHKRGFVPDTPDARCVAVNRVFGAMQRYLGWPPLDWIIRGVDLWHFPNFIIPTDVRKPTVLTVHDLVFYRFPDTMQVRNRELHQRRFSDSLNRASHIVTDSLAIKREIIETLGVAENRISVVHCGVDASQFKSAGAAQDTMRIHERLGISADYLLYVGTLEPRKNLNRLVEAFAALSRQRLAQDMPRVQLVLAGKKGWGFADVAAAVARFGLERDVIFTDYITDQELQGLYQKASAFVFPSLYEGFGIPPLEAMASGVPVAVSNVSSLPEVVGDAGLYFDPLDSDDMARTLSTLLENQSLAAGLRSRGLARSHLFSWDRTVTDLMAVYREVADRYRIEGRRP